MRSVKTSGGLTRGRGMTESQRLVWVMSMPACADVNNAMQELTGTNFNTSDQHTCGENKEASKTRMERDFNDTIKIINYLSQRNPFSADTSLRNIATGVVSEKGVNCDVARDVGDKILKKMINKNVLEFSFERKDQVKTLASKTALQLADGKIQIDPQLLFQRLSILATSGRYDNPQSLFTYEMSSYPTTLFDTSLLLRQANKPALADAIWEETEDRQTQWDIKEASYVLDGGALIHRVLWPRGATYDGVCSLYVEYVQRRYGNATIVFDGYDDGPTTKDCTHQRRGSSCTPPVLFDSDMLIMLKKKDFLANKENKQRFINLLGSKLMDSGCRVIHGRGDADLLIVKTAVEAARHHNTILVGDDTDLLVLLLYYSDDNAHDLFFKPEPKQRCDTTSRIHGIGKAQAIKKLKSNEQFRSEAAVFSSDAESISKDEVVAAGEKALICLYNGTSESLNDLRYQKFYQKVSSGTAFVQPESLPPTSDAARFHSLRVFLQVQQWKGVELLPQDWGWELKNGNLVPIRNSLPAAHPSLLEFIRCNCKSDCSSRRCSCRKNSLECTSACGTCRGGSCTNSQKIDLGDEHGQV